MTELVRLKKHQFIPFLNIGTESEKRWARIGKSTIFELTMNAETEDSDYIEDESPTTELKKYVPAMEQELVTNAGDPAFDFIYNMMKNRVVGEDAKKEFLLVFAGKTSPYDAWDCPSCTVVIDKLNTVDQKISFSLNFGPIIDGTVTVSEGTPTFSKKGA